MNKQHEYTTHYGQDKCLGTSRESKCNNFTIFNGKDMGISPGMISHLHKYLNPVLNLNF